MQWYYLRDGQRHGPINNAAFREQLRVGAITDTTLVWHCALIEWTPSGELPPLKDTTSDESHTVDLATLRPSGAQRSFFGLSLGVPLVFMGLMGLLAGLSSVTETEISNPIVAAATLILILDSIAFHLSPIWGVFALVEQRGSSNSRLRIYTASIVTLQILFIAHQTMIPMVFASGIAYRIGLASMCLALGAKFVEMMLAAFCLRMLKNDPTIAKTPVTTPPPHPVFPAG